MVERMRRKKERFGGRKEIGREREVGKEVGGKEGNVSVKKRIEREGKERVGMNVW